MLRLCHGERCGLSLLTLDGSAPKPTGIKVPDTNVRPTLWDKTIAWYEHGVVRTKTRTLTSVAKGSHVLTLDLNGDYLALNVNVFDPDDDLCGKREISLLKVGAKRAHLIARQSCGLDGQTLNGPSFDGGWLYFARACNTSCGASRYGATATARATTRSPATIIHSSTGHGAETARPTSSAHRTAWAAPILTSAARWCGRTG